MCITAAKHNAGLRATEGFINRFEFSGTPTILLPQTRTMPSCRRYV
jgi:hypothetical protein